jgi:hypothetical protein
LIIKSDTIPESDYANHVNHTLRNCKSIIYLLDKHAATSKKFLAFVAKAALLANARFYIVYIENDKNNLVSIFGDNKGIPNVTSYLESQNIAVNKLSGITWISDGLKITKKENNLFVESPIKFADVIFQGNAKCKLWDFLKIKSSFV